MTEHPVKRRKKLIEVAIPLEAINAASAREKSIRHGHPSTLHLWWARRPLAAARAVIFSQMVDDPSAVPEEFPTEEAQENERLRLFSLISELVTWENTTNEKVLDRAREEIRRSWRRCCTDNVDHPESRELFDPEKLPGFHDPFAGGGALPLEAQRLGLESHASDLNPVAVLINKAMIEIPPRFAGKEPINPSFENKEILINKENQCAKNLADDVRFYGEWIRNEAQKRIGHLYPKARITTEIAEGRSELQAHIDQDLEVISWIWARTVSSPNPAFAHIKVPLASTFFLSSQKGKEAYIQPIITSEGYEFEIRASRPEEPEKVKNGTKSGGSHSEFLCLMSGTPMPFEYLRRESREGRMGCRLMAIVVMAGRKRLYIPPIPEHEELALGLIHERGQKTDICHWPGRTNVVEYGIDKFEDLYTDRQFSALSCFCSLVQEVRDLAKKDAEKNISHDLSRSSSGEAISDEAKSYADAIAIYLGITVSKAARFITTLSVWRSDEGKLSRSFGRQAIPMTWDFAETNPFSSTGGDIKGLADGTADALEKFSICTQGKATQEDACAQNISLNKVISTDPPYYDNIGYADLSDYFYCWLRSSLKPILPGLFATVATPKGDELIAAPTRHGSKKKAEQFFLSGMTKALKKMSSQSNPSYPVTIYYAFKQAETKKEGTASTGWSTFLAAVVEAGFSITGTWPIRTEGATRVNSRKSNTLASSVVLVCFAKNNTAPIITRAEFRRELRNTLPASMQKFELANIAPVDIAQAAIGPGISIFSQAEAVLNPDDSQMNVRDALIEINAALDDYLAEDEGSFDSDTRFALTFFESYGYEERAYGDAEGLAVARNISVEGVSIAGILSAIGGKAQLLRREQLEDEWDPSQDDRLCVWEATQHLIRALDSGGEASAAALLAQLKNLPGHGELAANCRALAYRLYNHCEKTKQTEEARAYNGLVIAWPELQRLAASQASQSAVQTSLI